MGKVVSNGSRFHKPRYFGRMVDFRGQSLYNQFSVEKWSRWVQITETPCRYFSRDGNSWVQGVRQRQLVQIKIQIQMFDIEIQMFHIDIIMFHIEIQQQIQSP
jgi:hypothetical protein